MHTPELMYLLILQIHTSTENPLFPHPPFRPKKSTIPRFSPGSNILLQNNPPLLNTHGSLDSHAPPALDFSQHVFLWLFLTLAL